MAIKVLLCSNKKNFAHNTKFMFEYLKLRDSFEVKYLINDETLRQKLISNYGDHFISGKKRSGRQFMKNCDVWLLDSGMPTKNILYMRKKLIINFWHGVPIKRIGINGYDGLSKIRVFVQLKIFSYFVHFYTATSQNLVDIFAKSFILPINKVKVFGQPRNDYIHLPVPRSTLRNFYSDIDPKSKCVIYAPTWRKSKYGTSFDNSAQFFPFKGFDFGAFNEFLKTNNIIFFLRPHSLENIEIKQSSNIKILDSQICPNINEIINVFDLLITDYSGIFVDFLLLNKPIILLPYDKVEYEARKGLNFDLDFINPGPKVDTYYDFVKHLLANLKEPTLNSEKRQQLRKFFFDSEVPSMIEIEKYIIEYFK